MTLLMHPLSSSPKSASQRADAEFSLLTGLLAFHRLRAQQALSNLDRVRYHLSQVTAVKARLKAAETKAETQAQARLRAWSWSEFCAQNRDSL